jgi:hypothetical protein
LAAAFFGSSFLAGVAFLCFSSSLESSSSLLSSFLAAAFFGGSFLAGEEDPREELRHRKNFDTFQKTFLFQDANMSVSPEPVAEAPESIYKISQYEDKKLKFFRCSGM